MGGFNEVTIAYVKNATAEGLPVDLIQKLTKLRAEEIIALREGAGT